MTDLYDIADANTSKGLQATLDAVAETAFQQKDFQTWKRIKIFSHRKLLGIPDSVQTEEDALKEEHHIFENWKLFEDERKKLCIGAGIHYEKIGDFATAGEEYIAGRSYAQAIRVLELSSTRDSHFAAAELRIEHDKDAPKGFEVLVKQGQACHAFYCFEEFKEQQQNPKIIEDCGATLLRTFYDVETRKTRDYLKQQRGKKELPKEEIIKDVLTLGELLREAGERTFDGYPSHDISHVFDRVSEIVQSTNNPELLQIGLELSQLHHLTNHRAQESERLEHYCRAMLTGKQEHFDYLLHLVRPHAHRDNVTIAVKLFLKRGDPYMALEMARTHLAPENELREQVTREVAPEEIPALYKEIDDIIGYVQEKMKLEKNDFTIIQ